VQVHPRHDLMFTARRQAETDEFKIPYRRHRPMVERSISWLVADGHRRVRYRGVVRNRLGLSLRVAAINLRRLINLGLDHRGAGSSRRNYRDSLTGRVLAHPFAGAASRVAATSHSGSQEAACSAVS